MRQLTINGREEGVRATVRARRAPRGSARAILVAAVEQGGTITSTQAGRIRHGLRGTGCRAPLLPGAGGCCRWCATDGGEVLRSLQQRGYVERVSRGLYAVLEPGETPRPRFRAGA